VRREQIFENPVALAEQNAKIDQYVLGPNTILGWARAKLRPKRGD